MARSVPSISQQLRRRRKRRSRSIKGLIAAVILVAAAAGVIWQWQRVKQARSSQRDARALAVRFASAWSQGQLGSLQYSDDSSGAVARQYDKMVAGLGAAQLTVRSGEVVIDGDHARFPLRLSWTLLGLKSRRWSYSTSTTMVRSEGTWRIDWQLSSIYPGLTAGDRFAMQRVQAKRASILDDQGAAIIAPRTVVEVGVEPSRTKDPADLAITLAKLLGVNAASLTAAIENASPDAFVYVTTLRLADYLALKAEIYPLPGTVFYQTTALLPLTDNFAGALLGNVGQATAQIIAQSKGRYVAGEMAGLSGLENAYDARLAGRDGTQLALVSPSGKDKVLLTLAPQKGKPVGTTLDPRVQEAADTAVADSTLPTALVAVQPSSGKILAVANSPDSDGIDYALTGEFPPGSSFKVVSSYALMEIGIKPTEAVDCPAEALVDGHYFHNAEHEQLGPAPFEVDFARSCNTAFVGLSGDLSADSLPQAAALFGLDQQWQVGTAAFTGSVPPADGATDLAAAAFGQGRLLASPLDMAEVAATVDLGRWLAPELVTSPAPPVARRPAPLDKTLAAELRKMMRLVVTKGTGTAALHVSGGPVYGKTGTAEYGNGPNPPSHAWFIGYQGDIAFAVLVQGGGFGGTVATPIAAHFLDLLAKS